MSVKLAEWCEQQAQLTLSRLANAGQEPKATVRERKRLKFRANQFRRCAIALRVREERT